MIMNKRLVLAVLWRLAASVFTVILYFIAVAIYKLVEAPVTGVAAAKALDDTLSSYALAKIIREGGVTSLFAWIELLVLVFIWSSFLWSWYRIIKTTPEKTTA